MNEKGAFVQVKISLEGSNVVQLGNRTRRSEAPALRRIQGPFVSCDWPLFLWIPAVAATIPSIVMLTSSQEDAAPGWYIVAVGCWAAFLVVLWRQDKCCQSWCEWGLQKGSENLRAALRHREYVGRHLHQELARALLPEVPAGGLRIREEHLSPPSPFAIVVGGTRGRVVLPDAGLRTMHERIRAAVSTAASLPGTVLEVGALSYCAYSSSPCVPVKIRGAHGHIECYYEIA